MNIVLQVKDISYNYGDISVLSDVNFTVNQNDFLLIIGPNGGGKTTLVKLILGILVTSKGQIILTNNIIKNSKLNIGYVPQNAQLNIRFPITINQLLNLSANTIKSAKNRQKKIDHLLELCGLMEYKKSRLDVLSGGLKQRTLLVRSLINDPQLVVLDEPTNNIDITGKEAFCQLLTDLNKNITMLLVSHDLAFLPRSINKILCVEKKAVLHNDISTMALSHSADVGHHCLVDHLASIQNSSSIYNKLMQPYAD